MLILFALVRTAIVNLLTVRSPFAVSGRVAEVIIDSFKREARTWFQSHVCEKNSEITSPFRADRNSSGSVIFIGRVLRVFTPLNHVVPCGVLQGVSSPSVTVNSFALAEKFSLKTSARLSMSFAEMVSASFYFGSAITFTAPTFASEVKRSAVNRPNRWPNISIFGGLPIGPV